MRVGDQLCVCSIPEGQDTGVLETVGGKVSWWVRSTDSQITIFVILKYD